MSPMETVAKLLLCVARSSGDFHDSVTVVSNDIKLTLSRLSLLNVQLLAINSCIIAIL